MEIGIPKEIKSYKHRVAIRGGTANVYLDIDQRNGTPLEPLLVGDPHRKKRLLVNADAFFSTTA